MSISLSTTPLWAELATWKPSALEIIVRQESWGGAERLTAEDRYEGDLDPSCLRAGVAAAERVMELLRRLDAPALHWIESSVDAARERAARLPGKRVRAEDVLDAAGEFIDTLEPVGLDLVLATAHAVRSRQIAGDATIDALLALEAGPSPSRDGAMSSLLASSMDTLWIPASLTRVWESPFGLVASIDRLRSDVAALPAILRTVDPTAPREVLGAQLVVEAFVDALAKDGCIRMSG